MTYNGPTIITNQQSEVTQLVFGARGLDSTQLAQIRFADQDIDGGQLLRAQGELAPVPEPYPCS